MHERLAENICALAQNGIPALPNTLSTKMAVTEAARTIQELESFRGIILAQMQPLAKMLPKYDTVKNMNGVGDVLPVLLIAEIGDIRRFKNKHSLAAYAGIDTHRRTNQDLLQAHSVISRNAETVFCENRV